jgi:Rad3-related DNA helicase
MGADTAISDLKFLAHGELREGQHQMILDGNQVVGEGGFLLANAPTGIGKTAAALSTALSVARARESHTTILFMTGRQSQHRIIVDTVRLINERLGPTEEKVSLIDMIGLRGMCINELALEQGSGFNRACGELRSKRRCKPFLAESPGLPRANCRNRPAPGRWPAKPPGAQISLSAITIICSSKTFARPLSARWDWRWRI